MGTDKDPAAGERAGGISWRTAYPTRPEATGLDTWSDTPAFVLGHALDVVARNRLAGRLYAGFTQPDNLLRTTFLDPAAHHFHPRYGDRAAASTVATLRRAAWIDPEDPRLRELVGELSMKSADFRVLWVATTDAASPASQLRPR